MYRIGALPNDVTRMPRNQFRPLSPLAADRGLPLQASMDEDELVRRNEAAPARRHAR
jgi:hypothetical protein